MNFERFLEDLHAVRDRAGRFRQRVDSPESVEVLLTGALQELDVALEELRVTEEEVRVQNDALHDGLGSVEAERERFQSLSSLLRSPICSPTGSVWSARPTCGRSACSGSMASSWSASRLAGALHEVVAAAALLLAADGAGLMLADQARILRWVTATGEAERAFERAQRDLGEGPCIDAFLLDQVTWTADLRADPRWPRLGPTARSNQIRGVLSAPVSLAEQVLGTCNVIRWTPRAWTEAEINSVAAFATVIGRLLGATSLARHRGDLITQLQGALDSRIVIEQAKGVLMERDGLSDLEAFDRLRRQARSRSRTISEVAREVIASRAP